jgi:peptidoglycan/LPS O-acetylase OafA/YrhL
MTTPDSSRIRGLDGLRALSIGLVLVSHAIGTRGFPWPNFGEGLGDLGDLGVRVFFVISGFLITTLLLREAQATGISIKGFYIRRALRILPAFSCFLLAVAVLDRAGAIRLWPGDLLHSLTFSMNYHTERSWYVGHIWSLSVEEQFYLLWPALLCLAGIAGSMWSAAAAIAIAPVVRVLMFWAFPEHERLIHQAFPTTMDSIAAGCLYAGARHYFRSPGEGPLAVRSGVIALGLVAGAFICNSLSVHPWFKYAMGASLMNLAIVGVIDFVVNTNGRCDRVLNWPPIVYIGTLSYSLYLWQQLFMNRQSDFLLCSFPLNVLASLGVSAFSYQVLEQPLLRLRSRFRHQASPAPQKAMPSGITPALGGHAVPVEFPGPR